MTKGDDTREAVLDRAIALSSSLGLDGLSLGSLAKAVGLSKSGLFAHFDSKEDLQLQVIRRAAEQFIAGVVMPALQQPRGEPRVRALIENWLAWDTSPRLPGGCVFIAFSHELDDQPGRLRQALIAELLDWVDALRTASRIAIEEGHFQKGLDVEQFVFEGYGLVLSFHHYQRMLGDNRALERVRAGFDALIARSRA